MVNVPWPALQVAAPRYSHSPAPPYQVPLIFAKYHWLPYTPKFGSSLGNGQCESGQPGSENVMHIRPGSAPSCSTSVSVPVCGQPEASGLWRKTTLLRSMVNDVMNEA